MKRFLNKLFREIVKSRGSKPASRRTTLQLDGLEDRMVLSSVSFSPQVHNLSIIATAGGQNGGQHRFITLDELNPTGNRQIQVFDSVQGDLGEFPINSIFTVNIQVNGLDDVVVNDSDGMPFATGSLITLYGGGEGNSLLFQGDRTIAGNEDYNVSPTTGTDTKLTEDGLKFQFNNAIASVFDSIAITGKLDVSTSGGAVLLTSSSTRDIQTLYNLGAGGGGTLTYVFKPTVEVDDFGSSSVTLEATTAAFGENNLFVNMFGAGDFTDVVMTPSNLNVTVNELGSKQFVTLGSNQSPVTIEGNSSSEAFIGQQEINGVLYSTDGIGSNVVVGGVGLLVLSNQADTLGENIDVTESTISGFGMFRNNFAQVTYDDVSSIDIITATGLDFVNVSGSEPGSSSNPTQINVVDESTDVFSATIDVNSQSHLNVKLTDDSTNPNAPARLFIDAAPGAKFSNSHPKPGSGTEVVSYGGKVAAQVSWEDFTSIRLEE